LLAKLGNEFALAFSVAFLFWREKKWGIFSAHHRTKNMDQFIPGKINSLSASRWFFLQSDATATLQPRTTHESNRGSRTRENLINYEESNKYAFGIREAAYYGVLEMLCGDQRGLSAQQPEYLVQHNKIFCGQKRHFGSEAWDLGNGVLLLLHCAMYMGQDSGSPFLAAHFRLLH